MPFIKMTYGAIQDCKDISDEIVSTSRWTNEYSLVFEKDGKFYRCNYEVPATEMQEGSGTEDSDVLKCTEVHEVEKVVKVWEPVPEA